MTRVTTDNRTMVLTPCGVSTGRIDLTLIEHRHGQIWITKLYWRQRNEGGFDLELENDGGELMTHHLPNSDALLLTIRFLTHGEAQI